MSGRISDLKSVAIVDDVAGRLAMLTQYLEQAGFIAIPILGGYAALKLFALFRPDVAVINADLTTGVTAADLCKMINSPFNGDSSTVSNIIVVAREEQSWFSSIQPNLVSDYLILPFTAHHLIQAIRRVLDLDDDVQAGGTHPPTLVS